MTAAQGTESWDRPADEVVASPDPQLRPWPEDAPPRRGPLGLVAGTVLLLLAVGWIGFVGWAAVAAPDRLGLARDLALACVPLALIATLFLVLRGGNALRFGGNARAMRDGARQLDATLADLAARLDAGRLHLLDHARGIADAGSAATGRLAEASGAMRADAELLTRESRTLEFAAAAARADLAVLLEGMPKLERDARGIAAALQATGDDADDRVRALALGLQSLAQRGREVDEQAGGAADRLAHHVARLEGVGEAAGRELDRTAARMTAAVDTALIHAAEALERGRAGIDEQAAAMRALVEQARATLDRAQEDSAAVTAQRLAALREQVDAIGATLAEQDVAAKDLIGGLNAGLRAIEGRFADLGESGAAEGARLAATVQSVAAYAERVREGLVVGGDAADALIARAATLSERLEGPARYLHEVLPEALTRIESQARRSLSLLGEAKPAVAQLDEGAAVLAARLDGVVAALAEQAEASGALLAQIDHGIAQADDGARALDGAIGRAGEAARRVSEGSVGALVDAMLRVRETAAHAADRAREAIAAVIPESAAALALAGETALSAGVTNAVEGQIARLQGLSEEAVGTARRAADRLAGQMLALAETAAAVEGRIASARDAEEAAERDSFPRRAAHLIDALNSASIDIAKILSTEVTDSAWAAYLRGDRGIFTRRAVRLLDSGEARAVARAHGEDAEFRDQVNRYVHDFEALLRPVLAARDGAPLAVTLLGSDMGKLYVALAQAISRLRN